MRDDEGRALNSPQPPESGKLFCGRRKWLTQIGRLTFTRYQEKNPKSANKESFTPLT